MSDHILPLPALREDNPRDFLAALGLLRLVSLQWPELTSLLSWRRDAPGAQLHTCTPLPDNWSAALTGSLREVSIGPPGPLFHGEIIKTTSDAFRAAAESALRFSAESEHALRTLAPVLYAAYSSQNEDPKEGLYISAFSFGNGQSGKKLLLDITQLIAALAPEDLARALTGESSPVSAKSLRWNPHEFRPAAYRSHDPGKGIKGDDSLDYPAFNVLAFFGITFFPCVPRLSSGATTGIFRRLDGGCFEWPVWEVPLDCDTIASLVALSPDVPASRGVIRYWSSRRFSSDKSLYFAPATQAS